MTFDKDTQAIVECAECCNRYVVERHNIVAWAYNKNYFSDGEIAHYHYAAYCFVCDCTSNVSILEGDETDIPKDTNIFEY